MYRSDTFIYSTNPEYQMCDKIVLLVAEIAAYGLPPPKNS